MPIPWESKDEYEKRMKWWKEAKFGMFVHWGLYAIPAGVWNETRIPGIGEWIQFNAKISINEYEKLAKQFNPEKFNPDEWVSIAKESGMKYIVITAKHHDGFCLFDSKLTNYTVVKASPFKRDIIGELSKAAKKHGIKIGFYYSQTLDWHHKDALGNEWDFNPWEKNFEKYFKDYAIPQVEELIKNYDPDLLWFDIFTPTFEMARELRERIYKLKPQIIINGRINPPIVGRQDWKFICEKIAPKLFGDYISLGDNEIPPQKLPCYWEVPMTLNDTWGFKSYDHNWKSAGKVIQILLTVVSRGGNLLLNVGPTSEGLIPEPAVNVLKEVGNWLKIYGESIYGTIASPVDSPDNAPYILTYSPEKRRLYVHVIAWPWDGKLTISNVRQRFEISEAYMLKDRNRVKIKSERDNIILENLPKSYNYYDEVIVLEVSEK